MYYIIHANDNISYSDNKTNLEIYKNENILELLNITESYFAENRSKYEVKDRQLEDISETPEYIESEALKERERIGMLKMTKLDFFKYVVAPTGTTYAQLLEAVGSNDLLRATWDLCNHVYRGDEVMNTYATELLGVTSEQLDELFQERGD